MDRMEAPHRRHRVEQPMHPVADQIHHQRGRVFSSAAAACRRPRGRTSRGSRRGECRGTHRYARGKKAARPASPVHREIESRAPPVPRECQARSPTRWCGVPTGLVARQSFKRHHNVCGDRKRTLGILTLGQAMICQQTGIGAADCAPIRARRTALMRFAARGPIQHDRW